MFLHQRDAHADFIACMDNVRGRIGAAVVHCFTGEQQELSDYLDRGFHIGITGWICDERRGTHLRELVRHIPADRLMMETDAPYLLPRNVRPMPAHRRNEPMYLAHICAEVARDRGEDVATTAANAAATARGFSIFTESIGQVDTGITSTVTGKVAGILCKVTFPGKT